MTERMKGGSDQSAKAASTMKTLTLLLLFTGSSWLSRGFELPRATKMRTRSFPKQRAQDTSSRFRRLHLSSSCKDEEQNEEDGRRRRVLLTPAAAVALALSPWPVERSEARGLVQFPCPKLSNTYHLLRVGTTLLEEEGASSHFDKKRFILLVVYYRYVGLQ